MPVLERVDPEIRAVVEQEVPLDPSDLTKARQTYERQLALAATERPDPRVQRLDLTAPGLDANPAVRLRLFRPEGSRGTLPCVYWILGGGYIFPGDGYAMEYRFDDRACEGLVLGVGCAVVCVAWRAAPEHPFPACADDCYAGLRHAITSAQELRIDPSRVVIAGSSSGGGSAASLALRVRDDGDFTVAHQLLVYPMLDDTGTTPSSHQVTDPLLWNRDLNELAWSSYLGDAYGTDDVSPYAAPTRMHDLTGSVPASILTAELDLFRDEDIAYAGRLMAAEVPTELHVYPGAPHGFFRYAPKAGVSQRFFNDRNAILKRVFA